jgi:hypothetical protein
VRAVARGQAPAREQPHRQLAQPARAAGAAQTISIVCTTPTRPARLSAKWHLSVS